MNPTACLSAMLLACVLTGSASAQPAPAPAAVDALSPMPMPSAIRQDPGALQVEGGIAIAWLGVRSPLLDRAAARFESGLAALSGPAAVLPGTKLALLTIRCSAADPGYLTVAEHQGYTLSVTASGIRLDATGPAGVLEGFSTLLQLLAQGPAGTVLPLVTIQDRPRFVWRGLMIDVSRHFMGIDTLHHQIDAMERVKLDVLHLHLSDSQGWRVESRLYPRLQQIGSHGQFYTQGQIRALIAYAGDRGIRVVPEFDLPGHALALLQAYPALSATPPDRLPADFDPDQAALGLTNPETMRLVSRVYGEMTGLFPDAYFHAGGDEVSGEQWTSVPRIAAFMKAHAIPDADRLQARFTVAVQRVLAQRHKIMIGWDEVAGAPIPSSVAVQVWRSSKWIAATAGAGHPVIVSVGYYLDLMQPAVQHYAVDPLDPRAVGLSPAEAQEAAAEVGPRVMDFTRDPDATLDAAAQARVLGGEATFWTEIVSDEMLDSRVWPRAAAVAERFWSKAEQRDPDDMMRRLGATADRLEALGLRAQANRVRMTGRLAPGHAEPVSVLLEAVSPTRDYTLHHTELKDRTGGHPLSLNGLADIAEPDDVPARRLAALVSRRLAGDRAAEPALRLMLSRWQENAGPYAVIAAGNGVLDAALPVSQDVTTLSCAGLQALDRLDGHVGADGCITAAAPVIRQQAAVLANATRLRPDPAIQATDGLLMPVVTPIATLVSAAQQYRPASATAVDGKG